MSKNHISSRSTTSAGDSGLIAIGTGDATAGKSGSITMTVGSSGTGHVGAAAGAGALLIGREAKELGDLGGVISPTSLEDFNFQTAFVTPEMVRPPP